MASGNFTRSLARFSFDGNNQKCSFSNRLGAQRVKSAQGIIKMLMKSDFSPDLTPLLTIIGGGRAQPIAGGLSPTIGGTSRSRGGDTEAMVSPKRQTREAKLSFSLPQTGQWVYLVSMGDGTGGRGDRSPQSFKHSTLCLWAFHGKNRHQTVLVPPPPIVALWRRPC